MPRPEEINHPIYANIQFPDHEYREYPKHIAKELSVDVDGKPIGRKGVDDFVLVNDENEERIAQGGGEVIRTDELKATLIEQAKAMGVMIDKRWSPERLRAAMKAAGVTPEE